MQNQLAVKPSHTKPKPVRSLFAATLSALAFLSVTIESARGGSPPLDAQQIRAAQFVAAKIQPWLGDKAIVETIKEQNIHHAALSQVMEGEQNAGELGGVHRKLIAWRINNPLSSLLKAKKKSLGPVVLRMQVFDERGRIVGATDLTSGVVQVNDTEHWMRYGHGDESMSVADVGTALGKMGICQITVTIDDPASGRAIGGMRVNIDTDQLN